MLGLTLLRSASYLPIFNGRSCKYVEYMSTIWSQGWIKNGWDAEEDTAIRLLQILPIILTGCNKRT